MLHTTDGGQNWQNIAPESFPERMEQIIFLNENDGTSFNAEKTQIWIAISVYVLVAIIGRS